MKKTKVQEIATRRKWDLRWLEMATLVATWSGDNSMGVGCVIVGPDNEVRSLGYNDLVRGIQDRESRRTRPAKYVWTEHGERNAIYNAARIGTSLKGCKAYIACVPSERGGIAPCAECTRALIQAGIVEIVEYKNAPAETEDRPWAETVGASIAMLQEAGVNLRHVHI